MPTIQFNTISSDLQALALRAHERFSTLGYSVKVEEPMLGFPYTPALVCKRNQTTVVLEVGMDDAVLRSRQWIAYCKSLAKDVRLCLVVPQQFILRDQELNALREDGVGVLQHDGNVFVEVLPSRDLAMNFQLPELGVCSALGRRRLGTAYEHFHRGEWRDCFESACLALEDTARKNLIRGTRTSGTRRPWITLINRRGPFVLSVAEINRATMGQLKNWYSQIQSPRQIEVVLLRSLRAVLKDRNRLTHHRHRAQTEQTLRARVGRHMWAIVDAIRISTA